MALCLIGAVNAQDDATKLESVKSVYLPTTTNDYGSMIYSLLAEQANFLAAKDGAAVSSFSRPDTVKHLLFIGTAICQASV